MRHTEFLEQLDDPRIVSAIAEAEQHTSGEIRVYVSHKKRHEAFEYAKRRFHELGMWKTKHRNAVLIYFVPRTRQFAVLGDVAVHQKCGDAFWREIVSGMSCLMKAGQFTDAIVQAIAQIGQVLATHFPPDGNNPDELSNEIARD